MITLLILYWLCAKRGDRNEKFLISANNGDSK